MSKYSAIDKSLFDSKIDSDVINPRVLTNHYENQILNDIKHHISSCEEFYIMVAFLTSSGLRHIISEINENKSLKSGKILFTCENFITDPHTFTQIEELKRRTGGKVEFKLYKPNEDNAINSFHIKEYMFISGDEFTMSTGSANMTHPAFHTKEEKNISITGHINGQIYIESANTFNILWNNADEITEDFVENYKESYKRRRKFEKEYKIGNKELKIENPTLRDWQVEALTNLEKIRETNNRGLLIAATGSGKTFWVANHVAISQDERVLFIIHNRQIMKNAISDFCKLIDKKEIVEISGENFNQVHNHRVIFATQKTKKLLDLDKDFFDLIIVDESHRSAASEHLNIINHFTPNFLLGMTATPERTGNESSVFEIYNNEIIYEYRIDKALKDEVLAPIKYYGSSIDIKTSKLSKDEIYILSKKIIEDTRFLGYDGDKLRALIFVSEIKDGQEINDILNEIMEEEVSLFIKGGDKDTDSKIQMLKDKKTGVKFLVSVNVLSEGVDIPSVNTVIFIRNTTSKILFLQQLGRGLRKFGDKVTTVIDYIGNYDNNFIGIEALNPGYATKEKTLKAIIDRKVNNRFIDISLDEISVKNLINKVSSYTNEKVRNKKEYQELYMKLGRVPTIDEFINEYSFDWFINNLQINKSYYEFWDNKYMSEKLTKLEQEVLRDITLLAYNKPGIKKIFESYVKGRNGIAKNNKNFIYYYFNIKQVDGKKSNEVEISETLLKYINEILDFNEKYIISDRELEIHNKYTRDEVWVIKNRVPTMDLILGGQIYNKNTNEFNLFINTDQSTYENEILSERELIYFTDKNVKQSNELFVSDNVEVFSRFNGQDYSRSYYLGRANSIEPVVAKTDENIKNGIMKTKVILEKSIPPEIVKILKRDVESN